jgi:hypothetical protein
MPRRRSVERTSFAPAWSPTTNDENVMGGPSYELDEPPPPYEREEPDELDERDERDELELDPEEDDDDQLEPDEDEDDHDEDEPLDEELLEPDERDEPQLPPPKLLPERCASVGSARLASPTTKSAISRARAIATPYRARSLMTPATVRARGEDPSPHTHER